MLPFTSLLGRPRDDLYFNRCLVLARHFLRTNGLAPEFPDSNVKRRAVSVDRDTGLFSLALSVGNRFEIDFAEHAGTNLVDSFVDTEGMRLAFSAEGKTAAIAGTNLMGQSAALALATTMFHRQGHREPDFYAVQVKRMTTEPGPGKRRIRDDVWDYGIGLHALFFFLPFSLACQPNGLFLNGDARARVTRINLVLSLIWKIKFR